MVLFNRYSEQGVVSAHACEHSGIVLGWDIVISIII